MARIEATQELRELEPERSGLARALSTVGWGIVRGLPIIGLAIAWEIFARSGKVTMFVLPPFSAVIEYIWNDAFSGDLGYNLSVTLYRAITGFVIATMAGVGLGMLMSRIAFIHWFFDPIVSIGFPMPKIAFLPIVMLWLGVYDETKITMVVFDAIFPVVTATIAGIAGIERELIWSARNMGANDRELMWQIVLPAALPQILTGLQVALPIAMIIAVFCEMAMGGYGLGGAMMTSYRFARSTGVFAGIVEIAVIGYVLVRGMALLRRRLLIWHPEAIEPSTV